MVLTLMTFEWCTLVIDLDRHPVHLRGWANSLKFILFIPLIGKMTWTHNLWGCNIDCAMGFCCNSLKLIGYNYHITVETTLEQRSREVGIQLLDWDPHWDFLQLIHPWGYLSWFGLMWTIHFVSSGLGNSLKLKASTIISVTYVWAVEIFWSKGLKVDSE